MIFLWVFTLFWCGVSFTMMFVAVKGPAPWYAIAFISIFVLIGVALLYWLLATHYQRWRTGRVKLSASPQAVSGGETVTLRFDIERDDFAGRTVNFSLELQESDDGWTTRDTLKATGVLHPALRQATAHITVPANARSTSHSWRWQTSAHVDGLQYSNAECGVVVHRNEQASGPSKDTVTLEAAATVGAFDAVGSVAAARATASAAPKGAREIATGVWQWHLSSTALRVVGVVILVFAFFWLRSTGDFGLIRSLASPRGWSWGALGMALFSLPFIAGGLVMLVIGLALVTHRLGATVRRGEIKTTASALGMQWDAQTLRAGDIQRLQATASMASGPTVLRYSLAARTARGAVTLPFTAKSIDGEPDSLIEQARWVARALGINDVQFDPETMASDEPKLLNISQEQARTRISGLIGRVIGGAFALGLIGFALVFVWSLWSAR